MALRLQDGKILAQGSRKPDQVTHGELEVVVVSDWDGAHRDRREVFLQQVWVAARKDGGVGIDRERKLARGLVGIELQQLDELLRLGLHVDDQRSRLPRGDDYDIHALVADQLDERLLVGKEAILALRYGPLEHHSVQGMRDERGAAAQLAAVDLGILDIVQIIHRRVGPDDVVNLGVVKRQDYAERTYDDACVLAALSRPIDESLVDIGLDDREFHAEVVAKMLDVCGRTRRRQDLQVDRGIGSHEFGEIGADRKISALFIGGHDLLVGGWDNRPPANAKGTPHMRTDEFPGHFIPSSVWDLTCKAPGPRLLQCTSGGEAALARPSCRRRSLGDV